MVGKMETASLSKQHQMTRETADNVHLVTGGGGYTGYKLGKRLADMGKEVILVDIVPPEWTLTNKMSFIQCDLTQEDAVVTSLKGADCVYHLASYGMSGKEQFNTKLIEEVNIKGTENVIKACLIHGIRRLVYTSSNNVVFGGQEICNGDESLPYLPLENFLDHYSKTKRIAEQNVLEADKKNVLRTCALRLGGVYGVGEQRHIPRVVNMAQTGVIQALFGTDSLTDFLHVDNMVQAHILAAKALTEEKGYIAAGQAYFISDGAPINTFAFFRPLIEGLGYSLPRLKVPVWLMCSIAWMIEMVLYIVSGIYHFQPILTRMEVYKMGISNYFCINKASRDLGYKPIKQNEISDIREDFIKRGFKAKQRNMSIVISLNWCAYFIFYVAFTSFVVSCFPMWKLRNI
ncbi:short-chain dehydrogenase/reductase family 42E member 1-like isoform X1 [Saccostrea cucullata]|uniref:short-chain dehydrogenase/reductase family 42E member 1-like isoform X1 n=2 Tax=Saccostrea cuccullata TaxID=36930 RepID=UPI002ED1076A